MNRTHTCGALRLENVGETATLCGWIQRIRNKGKIIWVDLRDRYGITQLVLEATTSDACLLEKVQTLNREYVIQAEGTIIARSAKNDKLPTGDIELQLSSLTILNESKIPPFLIEEDTDGGEELRMKHRYLDLRRAPMQANLQLRHQIMQHARSYLNKQQFTEVETPVLIKSTPEGARDFLVPSRLQANQFYALPQSPQILKQLLMVGGLDRYYQFARCFRDEDLRSDRQPEFTQLDCELSFIDQEDILQLFENLIKHLFAHLKQIELPHFPRMTYQEAMRLYGSDKPDLRFGMPFGEITELAQKRGFTTFDEAQCVIGIAAPNCANYTRKQLDALVDFVKQPHIGAKGLVYVKYNTDKSFKSSVDKFFSQEQLASWAMALKATPGDLMLILAGDICTTRQALSVLRLKMGTDLGLRNKSSFAPLWIVDFPWLEWEEAEKRYHACHHPFTAPQLEDIPLLDQAPEKVRAQAYDLVINGTEIGGGSIRIHKKDTQTKLLQLAGFTHEEIEQQFGFLLEALEYGAPPHGGIALGLDRLCAIMQGDESIRSFIAFPKNNAGRDLMIQAPTTIDKVQLDELKLRQIGPA